jgi:hypothetical protein
MKRFLFLPLILCSASCFAQFTKDIEVTAPAFFFTATNDSSDHKIEPKVYINGHPKAKTFHLVDNCRLLKHKKETIQAVTEEIAKQRFHRTLCPMCAR